jgi:molybdate transport system ATP-binding protein
MNVSVSLRHRFGKFSLEAAFEIAAGGVTALFGPSGAGKSSIVGAIAGLLRPEHGSIAIDGRTLLDTQAGIFVPPHGRRIGVVFQDARLFPHMSVEDNLRFGWRRAEIRAGDQEVERVVALLGLETLRTRRPAKLSGGERGRVALARALLSSPQMLLLDEPLAALDAARKAEILPYIERLRDEARMPILYVSHSLDEVTRLADRVILLKDGHVAAQGSVFDLLGDLEFAGALGNDPYGAVFDARVCAHGDADGLSELSFAGGRLIVARVDQPVGARLRVRVRAEDVMLARAEPHAISANNVLPATVSAIQRHADHHADVQLACGEAKLVARITRASLARLELAVGVPVYAIIKSVTVDPRIVPAPEG